MVSSIWHRFVMTLHTDEKVGRSLLDTSFFRDHSVALFSFIMSKWMNKVSHWISGHTAGYCLLSSGPDSLAISCVEEDLHMLMYNPTIVLALIQHVPGYLVAFSG
jgi:hypothetical protein